MSRLVILFSLLIFNCLPAEAAGLRAQRVVLKGVLVRAGGPGGRVSLSKAILTQLCEEGYSTAYYLYPSENFKNRGLHTCSRSTIDYRGGGFKGDDVYPVLETVHDVIKNGGGAVIEHCWNGWHASGEVAAKALMQFCGYSGDRAAQYWADGIGDQGNLKKYGSIMRRIRGFEPRSSLAISAAEQQRICP